MLKKTWAMMILMIMMTTITTIEEIEALPAYRRLVKQTYSYTVSCAMCHTQGGGSAINRYGKDFLRNGANILALSRIENKDSDKDTYANLLEILQRSNPGDALSFPEKPGKWLENIEADAIPIDQLKKGFSEADGFTVLEGTLKTSQTKFIEETLGQTLRDEDKVPVFYFSVKKTNDTLSKYGVAQFIRGDGFTLCIGVNLKGKVVFVNLVKSEDKTLKKHASFFKQFVGKNMTDAYHVGKDLHVIPNRQTVSQNIALTVKKNMLIVKAVFSKQ